MQSVYILINSREQRLSRYCVHPVRAIYTNKESAIKRAHIVNQVHLKEEDFVTFEVYDEEQELPPIIAKHISPESGSNKKLPLGVFFKELGTVYAVVPNTDCTEGNGYSFLWVLTSDPILANKLAWGNGVDGSHAHVIPFFLDTEVLSTKVKIRRGIQGELNDELFW